MTHRIKLIALAITTGTVLSGCATGTVYDHYDDFYEAKDEERHTQPLRDHAQIMKISYFASPMMPDGIRNDLMEELGESDQVKGAFKDAYDAGVDLSTTGNMLADAAVGQAGSFAGTQASVAGLAAGFLISGLLSSDTKKMASQAVLPDELYGRPLDTQEDATWALNRMAHERFQQIGDDLSWEVECLKGCDPNAGLTTVTYLMKASPEHPLTDDFPYKHHKNIGMTISFVKPTLVEPGDLIQAFTDVDAKWSTGYGRTFTAFFYTLPDDFDQNPRFGEKRVLLDMNGIERSDEDMDVALLPKFERSLSYLPFGEALILRVHNTPFTYQGRNLKSSVSYLAHNGVLYGLGDDYSVETVETIIEVPELATTERLGTSASTDDVTARLD